ncbi:hypothetical protein KVT40_004375 [Elsinoe batatas]|uniref:Ankyrin repeat domain-containing protein n=1 Tax=Elsinoe batatas TaxID=2601811 RepID=A0A8K0PHG2_9PEZI|nr:hypothetical protein KVT40_004375 [Elsinoe batatas]
MVALLSTVSVLGPVCSRMVGRKRLRLSLIKQTTSMFKIYRVLRRFTWHVPARRCWSGDYCEQVRMLLFSTILHYLSRGKHWWHAGQCLPYLLKHPGIDIEARNKYGQTPLLLALAYNNTHSETCAQKFIESGANVMAVDNHGKTCLALAEGRTELLRHFR